MGYSNVELANQALDHIGKDRIANLSENSTAARKITEVFDRTLFSALARSHWSFARRIDNLANVNNDWSERWAFKYDYPSDCATLIRIVPEIDIPNSEAQAPHELLGGSIYTDQLNAKAEYVYKTTSTLTMPEPFLDAVSFLLARNISMPLTRKRSFWNELNQTWEYQLGLAIEHDAGQEPTFWGQRSGGYIDARGGGYDIEGAAPDGSIYWK